MVDLAGSITVLAALTVALGSHAIASMLAGRVWVSERVEREAALPLVGRTPMHAVYRLLLPIARLVVALGISANAVSVASLILAIGAAVSFGFGHFGLGAAIAVVASLADSVDGLVARLSGTASTFGKVLDTTIDRYVDVLLLGGIAVYRHDSVGWLVLSLAAIAGSFMVSYASSIEREVGAPSSHAPMRRAHRLAYLLVAATLQPFSEELGFGLAPILVAVSAIAIVGNVSAVRRLFVAAEVRPRAPSHPDMEAANVPVHASPGEAHHDPAE